MNIKYDKIADAVYVRMSDAVIADSVKLDDTHFADKDAAGNIVGFEILDASSKKDLIPALEGNVANGIPVSIINGTPIVA
ncbi:MAG: DUF2283 domain-containing protein [Patescibacteria group bacterium]|nr:DUF2283 domain-containing protein [Patescibacteria group bacterium]